MITKENKLHDILIVKKAIESVFNDLKIRYGFADYSMNQSTYDSAKVGITKNEIILYAFISSREAYEINVLKRGDEQWKSRNWNSLFFDKFPPLSGEGAKHLEEIKRKAETKDKYSFEWYLVLILAEIKFLEEYYPYFF